ncbi:hypothetical protein [Paenibacillus solanacearum]|nr:hypothetical protein [Paenibacillus solanacearum]
MSVQQHRLSGKTLGIRRQLPPRRYGTAKPTMLGLLRAMNR